MHTFRRSCAAIALVGVAAATASAQVGPDSLSLQRARVAARAVSPELAGAQAALQTARGRASQARAFPNPVVSFDREQSGAAGVSTSQDILALDQPIPNPALRSALADAARFRIQAAEARVRAAEADVDLAVTLAWARSHANIRRAALAEQVAGAFASALTTSERRLEEGDISGFAARRIRLEAARYAAVRAEAVLERGRAGLLLETHTGLSLESAALPIRPSLTSVNLPPTDSLVLAALSSRADLAAADAEIAVTRAESRVARSERFPMATLTVGSKMEQSNAGQRLNGYVAGVALPLPLWDRRMGATQAGAAEIRRREVESTGLRRAIAREVREAAMSLQAVQEQLRVLGPTLQLDAQSALRAAQVAYNEGELTLLEWLDTVRAYYELESAVANLQAEQLVRAATLEHAVGMNLFPELR